MVGLYTDVNGITVRKLKQLIADWPEEDQYGDETEVWIQTGDHHSNQLVELCPLNHRIDEAGKEWSDIMLSSSAQLGE
jgi:hypothetical protein